MCRVSQRILVKLIFLIFFVGSFSSAWAVKRVFSLSQAPDKTPLINPYSVIFEKDKFYVADSGNGRLVSYDLKGNPLVALNPEGKLKRPIDLAFRNKEELWIIDKDLEGLYKVDFARKLVKEYILNYKGKRLRPAVLQIYEDKMYLLDRETGGIAIVNFEGDNLVAEKIFKPEEENFKGFTDFRVTPQGIWALSRLNKRVYHWDNSGNLEIFPLKRKVILPVSLEIRDNRLFILDRYLAKVIVFELPSLKKLEEFGEKGWSVGKFYRPVKIRNLYYNYIGIVDEGNGRVEIFQF